MTPPESPSALLERAAAALEQRAAHFEDYRETWQSWPPQFGGPVDTWVYDVTEGDASQAGKQWVETMNPTVAPPLVEWLRKTAQHFAGMDEVHPLDPAVLAQRPGQYGYEAVSFARAVLGETPENTP